MVIIGGVTMTIAAITGQLLGFNIEASDTYVVFKVINRNGSPFINAEVTVNDASGSNQISSGRTDYSGEVHAAVNVGSDNIIRVSGDGGTHVHNAITGRFRYYDWLVKPVLKSLLPDDKNFPLIVTNMNNEPIEGVEVTIVCTGGILSNPLTYNGVTTEDGLFLGQYHPGSFPVVTISKTGYQTRVLNMDALLTTHYPDSEYIAIPKLKLQQ